MSRGKIPIDEIIKMQDNDPILDNPFRTKQDRLEEKARDWGAHFVGPFPPHKYKPKDNRKKKPPITLASIPKGKPK